MKYLHQSVAGVKNLIEREKLQIKNKLNDIYPSFSEVQDTGQNENFRV